MLRKDLLEKIKNAKEDEDINALLVGTDIETQFKGAEPTLDTFKDKLKTDKIYQQFMDSERDTYHSKAIKTMKEKGTWESEFSDAMKAKYPDLVPDPQAELKKEIADLKAEGSREKMLNQAVAYAAEKGLKIDSKYIGKLLGEDFDSTKVELDGLLENWSKGMETSVNERMKASSYVPGGIDKGGEKISIGASMAAQNNGSKTAPSDPWASK
jgi:hypothetical protein